MSQLDELRHIIVGDNSEQIAELKDRIEDVEKRTQDVAEVLSPAIVKEVSSADSSLVDSLQKPVSLGLKRAIRSEPQEYAEILYPVMAPSIRRAIAQAISSMMVTINRTIESATTVQGVNLRYQSLRTGIPYAELALRRTLLYRVEHLYLIHRETGMAMINVHAEDTETLDSDAVSAMFSAIQSFVQDSFSQDETSRLTDLKVGEQNVWVAHSPHAMLACVIRGDAPESLKADLYDTLDLIRTRYGNDIIDFDGDQTPFDEAGSILGPLLQSELKEHGDDNKGVDTRKSQPLSSIVILIGFGLTLLYFVGQWAIGRYQISTVSHFLAQTPGVSATYVYWDDDKLSVDGFKDPDAIIPYDTFESYGIKRHELRFKTIPFRSLEPQMELQRFTKEFDLPSGVTLEFNERSIHLSGEAPLRWLEANGRRLLQLAADRRLSINGLSASTLSVTDRLRSLVPPAHLVEITTSRKAPASSGIYHGQIQISGKTNIESLRVLQVALSGNEWLSINVESE